MKKKHEKSACCRAAVIKFGGKRRRCKKCKKTWSVWKRKRGRKKKRISVDFVKRFLNRDIASLESLARQRRRSPAHMQDVLKKSRDLFIRKTLWPEVPKDKLILIADAVVEMIEQKWHTIYLTLVRSVSGCEAVILPPVIARGVETGKGWKVAIDSLSSDVKRRIVALVCDGHRGLVSEAKWRDWLIQRCQFHLFARIQSRRSRSKIARNTEEAKTIFRLVRLVLGSADEAVIKQSLDILEEIGWHSASPEIQKVLSGFVTNYKDYRTHLAHPELCLPTTSNTAESLASSIADLKHRMRGFPTLNSFTLWTIALLKHKQKITCNGFHQQN